jgi:uncharacterized coiled-coil DUF342 family protein
MSDEVTRQAAEASADRKVARDDYDWMVQNRDEWKQDRDEWKQCADTLEGAVQRMTAEIQRLTAERDAARADLAIVRVKRNESQAERDAALADLCQAEENNHGLMIEVQNMRAGVALATEERDAAERERTESRAEALQLRREYQAERAEVEATREERDAARAERDAALADMRQLRAERDAALAEVEGLRADLLAHPPEVHAELAAERKRHLELMEDYDRQAVVIGILEEAVKRAENALATAQAKHVDERLKGFLAVISQLADQAQDLLP